MVTTSDREEIFPLEPAAVPHARSVGRPGILVFSRGLHLLYVNRRALELLDLRSETGTTELVRVDLCMPVIDLCTAVFEVLEDQLATGRGDTVVLRRTVDGPGHRLQLRGVGLRNREASDRSRIVVCVEDVGSVPNDGLGLVCDQPGSC
jgi:PAS domain-containing protein